MEESRALVRIGTVPLDEAELADFVRTPESGGVTVFSGIVRNHHEGRDVMRIEYTGVPGLAEAKLREIAEETLADETIHRVAAVHRLGLLEVGEASVIVAASAAHREDAFRAARLLIDRIKEALPVWKREHFEDGTREWAPGFSVPESDRSPGPAPEGADR